MLVSRPAQTLMSVNQVKESVQMASASTRRGLSAATASLATRTFKMNVTVTAMILVQVFLTQLSDNVSCTMQ